jgi:dipeptidase
MDRYFDFASGKTFVETGGKYAGERMPLYIKPNHKVSAQALKDCMRDQYEGTPLDITQGPDAGPWNSKLRYGSLGFKLDSVQYWFERPIATQQTAWSFVAQMRGYEGANAGGIFWFGVDDAASTVYVPMYSTITEVPECFKEGNGDMYNYSPTSAWWTYNIVANWAYTKYSAMMPDIKKVQATWEDKFNAQVEVVDQIVAAMSATEATEFLTKYSVAQAQESTAAWKELGIYLFVKYLDGQQRKEKDGQFLRNPYGEPAGPNRTPYPTSFLESVHEQIAHE